MARCGWLSYEDSTSFWSPFLASLISRSYDSVFWLWNVVLYNKYGMSDLILFFFSSRRRHTRLQGDWSSDVCSSDLRASAIATRCVTSLAPTSTIVGRRLASTWVRRPLAISHRCRTSRSCAAPSPPGRSEERRVGKECRSRWSPYH